MTSTESHPVSATVYTSSFPPDLFVDELEAHSVKLSWTPPTNLVTGSDIKHYTISYTYMSGHNKMEKKVQGDITSTYVTDLVSGIQYNFKIKMLTTHGETDYSNGLLITTPSNAMEIEKIQQAFTADIDKMNTELRRDVTSIAGNLESKVTRIDEKVGGLEQEIDRDVTRIQNKVGTIETKVKKLAVCGFREKWEKDMKVITYENIVEEVSEFGKGTLDKNSGQFTAPVTGLYEVSAAARYCMVRGNNEYQTVYLMKANHKIDQLMYQGKSDDGLMWTPCSGFRYVHLDKGDTLYLDYRKSSANAGAVILGLKYCVALFDMA